MLLGDEAARQAVRQAFLSLPGYLSFFCLVGAALIVPVAFGAPKFYSFFFVIAAAFLHEAGLHFFVAARRKWQGK